MCIYLGNGDQLTYHSREHIFPAGLGGRATLAQGMVSDQVNNLFSILELQLMRNSLVSLNRCIWGPGKRGSSVKHSRSNICVYFSNGKSSLGCLSMGDRESIPHIRVKNNTVSLHIPESMTDGSYKQILEKIKNFEGRINHIKDERLNEGEILFGFDPKSEKYYLGTKNKIFSEDQMRVFLQGIGIGSFPVCETTEHAQLGMTVIESPDVARACAKIAMNALAYLKGPEFVCHRNFDKFREWIVYGKHAEQFYQLPEMHSPKFPKELIPKLAHFCLFTPFNGRLLATVTLYNSYSQCFVMGDLPELTFSEIDGVICDWSKDDNQVREYTLRSAIFRMCKV